MQEKRETIPTAVSKIITEDVEINRYMPEDVLRSPRFIEDVSGSSLPLAVAFPLHFPDFC